MWLEGCLRPAPPPRSLRFLGAALPVETIYWNQDPALRRAVYPPDGKDPMHRSSVRHLAVALVAERPGTTVVTFHHTGDQAAVTTTVVVE